MIAFINSMTLVLLGGTALLHVRRLRSLEQRIRRLESQHAALDKDIRKAFKQWSKLGDL